MSNELLKKGAQLTLFLFTDCLEICKPRLKLLNANKSPNSNSKQRTPTQKCYKHIALFSLNNVIKVCDITQDTEDTDLFGIVCRLAGEKDKFFPFKVIPSTSSCSTGSSINTGTGGNNSNTNNTQNSALNSTNTSHSAGIYSTINSASNSSSNSSIYASTTNLNFFDEHYQAVMEKRIY